MKQFILFFLFGISLSLPSIAQNFWSGYGGPYGGTINDIVITSSGVSLASTSNGIWRSTDDGITWTKANTSNEIYFNDLEIDNSNGNIYATTSSPSAARIYKSTDGGLNFSNVNTTPIGNYYNFLKVMPNGTIIGVNTINQLWGSSNSGVSFDTFLNSFGTVYDLEVDAANNIYVAQSTGVRVSTNGGSGLLTPSGPTTQVYDISINGTNIVALATNGPYLSINAGTTFTSIKSNLTDTNFSGVLKFSPDGSLFLANTNSASLKTFSSPNNGTSWSSGTSFSASVGFRNLAFRSAGVFLAGALGNGIFKSTNSGAAWTPSSNGIKVFQFSDILVSANGTVFMAGTSTRGVYLSSVAATTVTFNASANADRLISNFLELNGYVYAYSPSQTGIIRSADNGATWAIQNAGQALTNLAATSNTLYSISGTNLLSSVDGVSWTTTAITGAAIGTPTKVLASNTPNTLFVQNNAGVLFKVNVTTFVSTQLSLTGVLDFAVGGNALYALTSTTNLQKSTDDGANFTPRTLPGTYACNKIWAFDDQSIITRNANTGIYAVNISYNSGQNWSQKSLLENIAGVSIVDLQFTASTFAYAAVSNSVFQASAKAAIPPKAPTNLKLTASSPSTPTFNPPLSGALEFSMDDNSNNEEYFLTQRSTDNLTWDSATYELAEDLLRKRVYDYNYDKLVQGTTYYYRVQAVNTAGRSAFTNVVTAPVTSYCVSAIPINRSWSGTATADPGSTPNAGGPFTNATVSIIPLIGSQDRLSVSALTLGVVPPSIHPPNSGAVTLQENCGIVNIINNNYDFGNGLGTYDNTSKTLTLKWQSQEYLNKFEGTTVYTLNAVDPAPAVPSPGAYVYSSSEVFVTWNSIAFATEYVIERSVTGSGTGFSEVNVVPYPLTSYIDKNLTVGTTYYYRMRARHFKAVGNAELASANSAEVAVQLGPTLYRPIETDLNANFDSQQGASWGDFDDDGDEDMVMCAFTNNQGGSVNPTIFENIGNGQLKKKDLLILANETPASTRGAGVMDFNNDGKLDIYFNRSGLENDFVLINSGAWNFTKLLVNETVSPAPARENMAFSDIDKDGFVDFYVGTGNVGSGPPTIPNYLIKNNGGTSITQVLTGTAVTNLINSASVSMADYDNDGDQDIFAPNWQNAQATPVVPSELFKNNGDGTFTKVTGSIFDTDLMPQARTTSWGDIDNDGDLDLYFGSQSTQTTGPNVTGDRLYRNDGGAFSGAIFTSLSSSPVVADVSTGTFGSAFGDIDNDGDLDLVVTNGGPFDVRGENAIFKNDGLGNFTKVVSDELFTNKFIANLGVSLADIDKDGFLEIFPAKGGLTGAAGDLIPNLLYKSTQVPSASAKWLQVKLIGTVSNKAAIGARITAVTTSPARSQIREVSGLTGYGSQNSLIQHFGLGSASTVSSLQVRWPNGKVQTYTNVSANQILTITEDATGPVATLSPIPGASNVSSGTALKLTLNEPATRVAGKYVSLYKTSDLVNYVYRAEATALAVSGDEFTFVLPAKLEAGAAYEVVLDAGAFVDASQNSSLAIPSGDWTFTVGTGPSVLSLSPVNSGVSINTNSKIEITFNGATTAVATKKVDVYKVGTPPTLFTSFTADQGVASGNKVSFSLPSKLSLNTQYYVTIEAGAFVDDVQNDFPGIAAAAWQFTTAAGPEVDVVTPSNAASNVPVNANIEVTFKQPVTAVAGKKLQIKDGATIILDVDVSTTGTISGNKYTLDPATDFPFLKALEVIIQPGAFIDIGQNDFKGLTTGQWTFTTIEAADVTAPAISFDPVEFNKLEKGFSPKTLAISASDNKAVTSAVMYHRKITEKDYTATALSLNAGKWETIVASTYADEMGFEYYFRARDAAGNKGRLPADSSRFISRVTLTALNRPQLDLPGGASQSSWKVIAIPYELANSQIESVFFSLGSVDKTKWKIIRLTANPFPKGAWVEYPASGLTEVERGKGYFINTKDVTKITLTDPTAPSNTRDNLFTISLVKGWNQIGNPYTTSIKWSEAITYNNASATVGALKMYTGGTYVAGDELAVSQGGFVNVQVDVPNFKIPFKGQTTAGGRIAKKASSSELSETNWSMPITLTQQGVVNELSAIGMNPGAHVSFDEYDDATPPRFFDYLELSFDHPEHFNRRFSRDVVPTQNEYTWEFAVNTNLDGMAELTWDNTILGDNDKELYLLDIQSQRLVNMREVQRFAFNPSESSKFKLFFGTNLKSKIMPNRIVLGKAYPNPTTGMTNIPFSLPDQAAGYQVSLEVYDNMGRKINTIINGTFNPGFYNSEWDAGLGSLSNGIYTYRLAVSSSKGSEVQSGKIIIKR